MDDNRWLSQRSWDLERSSVVLAIADIAEVADVTAAASGPLAAEILAVSILVLLAHQRGFF
jgi:hypothetical protein